MISVVIPTYNRAGKLAECLTTLRYQSLTEGYEVIVVDDGSEDETKRVVTELQYPNMTYVNEGHHGPSSARNAGVRRAHGDVILFMGDDVIADRNLLQEHALFHETHKDCVCLGFTKLDPRLEITYLMRFLGNIGPQFNPELVRERLDNLPFYYFMTANISLKKKAFSDVGFFDETFKEAGGEDIEFGFRLAEAGYRIVFNEKAKSLNSHFMDVHEFIEYSKRKGESFTLFVRKHEHVLEIERLIKKPSIGEGIFLRMFSKPLDRKSVV